MLVTLFTCYDIACKGSGIQAIDKATEVLSIMVVCKHSFHNGVMAYIWYKLVKVPCTEFLWHGLFLWKQYSHVFYA